jgi:hypothetical protein
MTAYELIKEFYGMDVAKRSGIPLINHIDEGLKILDRIGASDTVKEAFCLHPLLQSDEAFNQNKSRDFPGVSAPVLLLTMEYRRVANSYLSKNEVEDFVGFSCEEVKQMLIADKIQNYKDFLLHHYGHHDRSDQLYKYFHNWFDLLGVNYENWEDLDQA